MNDIKLITNCQTNSNVYLMLWCKIATCYRPQQSIVKMQPILQNDTHKHMHKLAELLELFDMCLWGWLYSVHSFLYKCSADDADYSSYHWHNWSRRHILHKFWKERSVFQFCIMLLKKVFIRLDMSKCKNKQHACKNSVNNTPKVLDT